MGGVDVVAASRTDGDGELVWRHRSKVMLCNMMLDWRHRYCFVIGVNRNCSKQSRDRQIRTVSVDRDCTYDLRSGSLGRST